MVFENYFKEVEEINDKLKNADYVHYNIPVGAVAIAKYKSTITSVSTIDVSEYDLSDRNSESTFEEVCNSLLATLEYYNGIAEVYDKTDFIISNDVELESLKQDCDTVFSIYVRSKEKTLLKKAIDVLKSKINEMEECKSEYQDSLINSWKKTKSWKNI